MTPSWSGMAMESMPAAPVAPVAGDRPDGPPEDALARLLRLVASNDRLLAELKRLDAKLKEADSYLEGPGANVTLGAAYRDRVRSRRSRVLALLRGNRLLAREFLPEQG